MNVYSELLEILTPRRETAETGLLGTVAGISPLTVTVRGTGLSGGDLLLPRGMTFRQEDIGRRVALLPCEGRFLILTEVEE